MKKKITYLDRKRMLEAHEQGLGDEEIKTQFGFTDNRTLKRHLRLAEQEQQARLAKVEILKDALADHLDAVSKLIEQWRSTLYLLPIAEVYKGTMLPTPNTERNPLFGCLREHLPFPTLWRNYSIWEKGGNEYLDSCKNLIAEIEAEGGSWQGVQRLTGVFARPVLERLSHKAGGEEPNVHRFEPHAYYRQEDPDEPYSGLIKLRETLVVDGREVLEAASNALALSEPYQALSDRILASEAAANLVNLFNKCKALEPKIHESLDEILLRHDYIMYSCKFCPGQPR